MILIQHLISIIRPGQKIYGPDLLFQNIRQFIAKMDQKHEKNVTFKLLQFEWMNLKKMRSQIDKQARLHNYFIQFPDEIDEALTLPYEDVEIIISKTWI